MDVFRVVPLGSPIACDYIQAEDMYHAQEQLRFQYGSDAEESYTLHYLGGELEDERKRLEDGIFDREVALRALMEIL